MLLLPTCFSDSGIWLYAAQSKWTNLCKMGKQQSPIFIDTKKVKYNNNLRIERNYYDMNYNHFNVVNNGKTIQLILNNRDEITKMPYLTGTAVNNQPYEFAGLHFHWSDKHMNGSEHRINNRRHEMEMHLVHYNLLYGNFSNALHYQDGMAVIAILFKVKGEDNPAFKPIIRGVISVNQENNNSYVGNPAHYPLRLIELFANESRKETSLFYRYHGSLTTPDCNESVTWVIFDASNTISAAQFREFENLFNKEGQRVTSTFREPQNMNGRIVECSRDINYKKIKVARAKDPDKSSDSLLDQVFKPLDDLL